MKTYAVFLFLGLLLTNALCFAQNKGNQMSIEDGKEVAINYTLTVNGEILDTSAGKEPLIYTQGQGQIIPGLSKALAGLKTGDKKNVTIAPEDAYGPINPEAYKEVPRSQLPPGINPQAGMHLKVHAPEGKAQIVRIAEVKDNLIVVDMNHPLAGKTLNFDVEIVSVK